MDNGNLEKVLSKLAGVHSVKLVSDGDGNFSEVHVLATADKAPKQIARDIETAILAYTGKRIDRKIISVAQIAENLDQEVELLPGRDLKLASISRKWSDVPVVEVVLEDDEAEYTGSSSIAVDTEKGVTRATILATLDALKNLGILAELESLDIINYPSYKIVLAVFVTPSGRKVQAYILDGDPMKAGAETTLKVLLG